LLVTKLWLNEAWLTNQSSYFGSVGQRLSGVVFDSSFSSNKTPVYVLSSLRVDKEKAQEIAMDWMTVFYGVNGMIVESKVSERL